MTVLVENKKDEPNKTSTRLRRELSDPVVIVIKENTKEVFKKVISTFALIQRRFFSVDSFLFGLSLFSSSTSTH